MITKKLLERLYVREGKSMKVIAMELQCSVHKVQYWMDKHKIARRSIADAIYQWHNPDGDPFVFTPPKSADDYQLYGLGIGLYWGEGTKANKVAVRLGNTDPELLKYFIRFLERFFAVRRSDMHFGLQIFTDIDEQKALDFWQKRLKIGSHQFYKVTRTISGSMGTYRRKSQYGVLTVYYNNRKLRDLLVSMLPP
ncbi:MAG: hypothetical protein QF442_01345 [Candidatus Peribacteraceae bacterium]|jgi:hypothetical protein|nr:hypothetical protein [Candidatus Peribacteraceae bacterium]